jgi:hypothetical protein
MVCAREMICFSSSMVIRLAAIAGIAAASTAPSTESRNRLLRIKVFSDLPVDFVRLESVFTVDETIRCPLQCGQQAAIKPEGEESSISSQKPDRSKLRKKDI